MNTRLRTVIFILTITFLVVNAWAATWTWLRIPHLAIGGGYTSYLTIRDPHGTTSRQIWVYLYDDTGTPLAANVEGFSQAASFNFSLGPYAERSIALIGIGVALKTGWVQVQGEGIGNINVSLRFSYNDNSGNVADAVGILPAEPNRSWTLAVEKRKSTEYTGVAIANPWTK